MHRSLTPDAPAQDAAALQALRAARRQAHALRMQADAARALRDRLADARYLKLVSALQAVNGQLATVYRRLTGHLGDASLSFTAERRLLFLEGLTLQVRPDPHRWRPFGCLSGGQQALATLALSFALQVSHWSIR